MKRRIDLNLDAGEMPLMLKDGTEARLYDLVSSINIACGGHAGDAGSMRAAVTLAKERGLAIGAHPSYPDREGFGRKRLSIPRDELVHSLASQIDALKRIAKEENTRLSHVKPHGALYNEAADDQETAQAVIEAVRSVDVSLPIVGLARSEFESECERNGVRFVGEAFIDRRYEADGRLRARRLPQAMIEDADEMARQALSLVLEGKALTLTGEMVLISAQTLCIHGDSSDALAKARVVRAALEGAGIVIARWV